MKIDLLIRDITEVQADAIVNEAYSSPQVFSVCFDEENDDLYRTLLY